MSHGRFGVIDRCTVTVSRDGGSVLTGPLVVVSLAWTDGDAGGAVPVVGVVVVVPAVCGDAGNASVTPASTVEVMTKPIMPFMIAILPSRSFVRSVPDARSLTSIVYARIRHERVRSAKGAVWVRLSRCGPPCSLFPERACWPKNMAPSCPDDQECVVTCKMHESAGSMRPRADER
jgi:hypothetical protein